MDLVAFGGNSGRLPLGKPAATDMRCPAYTNYVGGISTDFFSFSPHACSTQNQDLACVRLFDGHINLFIYLFMPSSAAEVA